MEPVKQFNETASTYGIGVAVLLLLCMGLIHILWKLGTRLTTAHENYLDKTSKAAEHQAAAMTQIQAALPDLCKANCPMEDCENYKPRAKPKQA